MKISDWQKNVSSYIKEDEKEEKEEAKSGSSLSGLKDVSLVDKLVDFIKSNPFPADSKMHAFADKIGVGHDEIEEYAYAMLTLILKGGKSGGKVLSVSGENERIGKLIEMEHVEWSGKSNAVIEKMQEVFIDKIRSDHGAEDNNYYVNGADFKKELKKEKK